MQLLIEKALAFLNVSLAKKSKKRPHRSNAKQVNKAKQVQLLQKQQQQQESPAAGAVAKTGRNKHVKSKSSQALASPAANGGGHAPGGHAPTGSGPPAHPWDPKRDLPTRGLLNLGNTCFFNSALQNVFKARLLHEALFADGSGRREGGYIGPLTKAFRKVLLEMTGEGPVGGRRGPYSPKALLSAVQRAHPSFRGFHQQDAHELFMRLVGTLEDEEDSCIKKRRQEEKEVQDAKLEEDVNGAGGGMGSEGGAASPAEPKAGTTLVSAPASPSPEEDRKPSADGEEGVGGALAGDDGALARPGAEKEGSDVVSSDNVTGRPATPDGLSLLKASSVLAPASGEREETSDSSDGAVATSPDASTDPLCDRGEAELSTINGKICARNGAGKVHTRHGKSTGDAGVESTEAAGAIASGEDEGVAVVEAVEAHHSPIGYSSENEKEMVKNDPERCGGGASGGAADADTSTDDGETTDAGDHDDDDDDEADGAAVSSQSRPPPGASAESAGKGDGAVGTQKEEEKDEHEDIVAVVAPAVPQRAAITEVFGGTMCSVVTCSSCGGRSFCTEPTICLSLEIPMKPKALSKTALAFIAKKKAAAAAKAAAASAETANAESGATTTNSTCTADDQPSPASSGDGADESATEPALGEEKEDEVEGFQLSAKEKRKVARQEREKQRLIQAKAKADDEQANGDAAGSPAPESDDSRPATTKSPTDGADGAADTPPEGDEVRQCLEYIVSACIADGGADGDSGGVAGLDSEAVAIEMEADGSEGEAEDTAGNAPEVLLPGFELSAMERKKIARQEKFERQFSMEQEASIEGGSKDVPQTSTDEEHEPIGEGGGRAGASEQPPPCATVLLEPEAGAARGTADAETVAQQSAEKPTAGVEGGGQGAAVDGSGKCSGGDGDVVGAGNVSDKDGPASNVATAVLTYHASPVAEKSFASPNNTRPEEHRQAQQATDRAAGACKRGDCDGRKCGDGPPASEDLVTGAEASDQVGQAKAIEAVAQVTNGGPQNRIEIENDPDGAGTLSSSGSLAGCTTCETQGSTDLRGDLGSAFGIECSEGPTNSALKCLASSNQPGTEENKGPGGHAPVVDSPPTGLEESKGATESEVVGSERGEGTPLLNCGVLAADENGHVMRTAGGSTAEEQKSEEVTATAPTASQSPLNRLEEPPARVKSDRRHDVDGIDLYGCLDHFMAEEKLVAEDGNGYDCEGCSSRPRPSKNDEDDDGGVEAKPVGPRRQQNAKKRLLMLGQPPGVLVCHLKRLQAKRKIIRSVEFPIELDMAPYFWRDPKAPLTPKQTCYRLTGLIQHRGSRLGGHYVAYVRDKDGWKHASDSAIRTATLPELKACEAYMLFYEQMGCANAEGDESGVSGIAPGCSDGDAVVEQTSVEPDAPESGGAALSTGSETAADAEAVEGEQGEKQDDEGEEGAAPEGQGEEEGEGVASGATEAQEEKHESDSAAEEGREEGRPNEEIWI